MQEGIEGNPAAATMKNVSRVIAALTVPFTMSSQRYHHFLFWFLRILLYAISCQNYIKIFPTRIGHLNFI